MTKHADRLEDLYELIEDIEIAMLTSIAPDGSLVSRPMATVERSADGHLWFMTSSETAKVEEIADDSRVNLAYYDDGSKAWVSVAGSARLTADRQRIEELYEDTWKIWLGDEGGVRDGSASDPRIILLDVAVESAVYFEPHSKPRQVYGMVKGLVTGERADLGETHRVG